MKNAVMNVMIDRTAETLPSFASTPAAGGYEGDLTDTPETSHRK
jgi:hypothetical protein